MPIETEDFKASYVQSFGKYLKKTSLVSGASIAVASINVKPIHPALKAIELVEAAIKLNIFLSEVNAECI